MSEKFTTMRVRKEDAKQLKKAAKQLSVENDGEEVTIAQTVEKLLKNIKIIDHI